MQKNLLEFLFGSTTLRKTADIGEDIVHLFEQAEAAELEPVKAEKKPLAKALKALGVDAPVKAGVQWCEIHCDDEKDYKSYLDRLGEPDAMSKLAEMGWVRVRCGDQAMSNEKPDYKIGFIEIQTAEGNDMDKPDEEVKTIIKKGQEFANTPVATDSDENPVERETGKPDVKLGGKREGVGKPADGKDPEGKPKGGSKKVKESAQRVAAKLLDEMTGTGSMGAFSGGSFPPLGTGQQAKGKRLCCYNCGNACAPGDMICPKCKGKKPNAKPK